MKKFCILLFTLLLTIMININVSASKLIDVYIFYSSTCPHCKEAKDFLKEYKEKNNNIDIHYYEVIHNNRNAEIFEKVETVLDNRSMSVPYIVIGSEVTIGFNDDTKEDLSNIIDYYQNNKYIDITGKIISGEITKKNIDDYLDKIGGYKDSITLPLIGKISIKEVSLPVLAILIGLVDGFNPCAMWVLLFLISMLINMKDKKRMIILGTSFILTSALVYALLMGAWLKVVINFASVKWIQIIIGIIALIGSAVNFRNYYLERKKDAGCQVVDEKKRKKILSKIRRFTSEKSFILALIGVIALAVSVNVVELACSAGLPVLFTNILAVNNITGIMAIIYISLYILFFMLDDLIVFLIAVFTFKVTGLTTKYTKVSHLIGAILMLIIGVLMIVKPEWIMFNF